MPLDPGANVYTPPKKDRKNKPSPVPGPVRGYSPAEAAGPRATPYQGAAVPGVYPQGDIHSVNKQVDAITLAFQNRFGHLPSPGLVFDLLRAPIDPSEYDSLFRHVPKSAMWARAAGPHSDTPSNVPGPHSDMDRQLQDPGSVTDALGRPLPSTGIASPGNLDKRKTEQMAMFGKDTPGLFLTAFEQVAQSLVYSPLGIYKAGEAVSKDIGASKRGDFSFKNSRAIGSAAIKQTEADFQHPSENPGYLMLDILGLVSVGFVGLLQG
jgi:hypothetical protein